MAGEVRIPGKLTALKVKNASRRGYLADGAGLYLQVTDANTKSWVYRYRVNGRRREMGLGSARTVSLREAREAALECQRARLKGLDPIVERLQQKTAARHDAAKAITFRECAKGYIDAYKVTWKNAKHGKQWAATLETYAYPVFGDLPVGSIDVTLVTKVLEPIWLKKSETASRLRGRIEAVLNWATVRNYREGLNPARWRGHLDQILAPRSKVRRVKHHAALPYIEIAAFITALRKQEGVAAAALEFAILTAARTGEVLGASWDEIDFERAAWTVPAARMKVGKEHRVPLSGEAIAVLELMKRVSRNRLVFPGGKKGKPLSNMAMLTTLRRMKRDDVTVHGCRSTFRDWASEQTDFPNDVVERALAHTIPNESEAAYHRTDLLERRRPLMQLWAQYCSTPRNVHEPKVVTFGAPNQRAEAP